MIYTGAMTTSQTPPNDPATQHAIDLLHESTRIALEGLHRMHDDDGPPPLEIDDAGIMHGEGVAYIPTVRVQHLATPGPVGERHVEGIVWHYTDTRNAGAANLARHIAAKGAARSCHVWIDAKGAIAQSASFELGTWHAGSDTAALFRREADATWMPLTPQQRGKIRGYGANSWAAGIELENVGEVRHVDGRWLGWPFKLGGEAPAIVPDAEVVVLRTDDTIGHHAFTDAQLAAACRVSSALQRRYGLLRANCGWTHAAIDPTRRTDPGPLFVQPLLGILDRTFGMIAA